MDKKSIHRVAALLLKGENTRISHRAANTIVINHSRSIRALKGLQNAFIFFAFRGAARYHYSDMFAFKREPRDASLTVALYVTGAHCNPEALARKPQTVSASPTRDYHI